jgi:DNA-binding Lrp family transcriptional regulator
MMPALLPTDADLLNCLQTQIPLVERPFAQIASQIGWTEADVLARVRALRHPAAPDRPVIRQISAIFDSKSLGYQTTLVAAKIPEAHLDAAAAIINQHPGVSHNYRRNHAFNLWYTLAVPPHSKLGLEKTLAILHAQSGALSTRMLPTLKLYKIGVKFDLTADAADTDAAAARTTAPSSPSGNWKLETGNSLPPAPTDRERTLVRILQQDLPLQPDAFAPWAAEAGISVPALLAAAADFQSRGLMRRFAAVLKHREAGISANAMGVWEVPPEKHESFGSLAATFSAVSHCYLRTTYPDWPYSIFTMVHAPTKEKCEQVLAQISAESGITAYGALYSSTEYKKIRVKYFTPDIDAWESQSSEYRL